MIERRAAERHRVHEVGCIALDEHTSIPCLVNDRSAFGVRLTLPNTDLVPETFVLDAPCLGGAHVCFVTWRSDETIGARLDEPAARRNGPEGHERVPVSFGTAERPELA